MSTVEEIVEAIEAIKELSPEKRDEVRRRLGSLWLSSRESSRYVEKSDHTYSPNLSIKRARPRRPPIQIKGKPISETIIEDRR